LQSVKNDYNILEIINYKNEDNEIKLENTERQISLNEALKYSKKIICLDADVLLYEKK